MYISLWDSDLHQNRYRRIYIEAKSISDLYTCAAKIISVAEEEIVYMNRNVYKLI